MVFRRSPTSFTRAAEPACAHPPSTRATRRCASRASLWALLLACTACGGKSHPEPVTPAAVPPEAESPPLPKPREPLPPDIVERSALPISAEEGGRALSEEELWQRLAGARAICFGERHDDPHHHYAQYRALAELIERAPEGKPLAAGFEMFQRPAQSAVDGYVSGELDEAAFLEQSEYAKRWGFDFALYRPLLEAARNAKLTALALNARKELTRKIGRGGVASLDEAERKELPELDLEDATHRAYFDRAMAGHPMPSGGPKVDDMYAAQVVWDETMASVTSDFLTRAGAESQIIVFAGLGHCHKRAIPARVTRRTGVPVLSVRPVLASEREEVASERERYDIDVILDDSAKAAGAS